MANGLTDKQSIFVEEYLKCWNATEAARRADYSFPNTQGPRLLVNVSIQEKIRERLDELKMEADEVLRRLAEQARGDHSEFVTPYGGVDIKGLIDAGKAHLIKKVKKTQSGIEYEFYDAQSALVWLGKHHGLFVDRQEISGPNGGPLYIVNWDEPADNQD